MKTILKFICLLTIFSCSSNKDKNSISRNEFPIVIDSLKFVKNLDYEKITYSKISDTERIKYSIDRITEKHGDKYLFLFYLVDSIPISDNLMLFITYSARNNKIGLDAYFEKYNLTTLDNDKKPIETIEIAKYEAHFGLTVMKTCTINEKSEIMIKTVEQKENFDNGEITETINTEKYIIDDNGGIKKSPVPNTQYKTVGVQ